MFKACFLTGLLFVGPLMLPANLRAGDADGWTISDINPITQIYSGRSNPNGTELILELRQLYDCIFVNGRIAPVTEYNDEDSYVRVLVELQGDEELVAYSGTVKAPDKTDPDNHAAMWKAFVNSPHKPFKAKLGQLPKPKWYMIDPIIRDRTTREGQPRLKPDERPAKAKQALDPATGDRDRFCAVWGLAISGYCPEGAEALTKIATDPKQDRCTRRYAVMGLYSYTSDMPAGVRDATRLKLREAFKAEKDRLPDSLMRTLIGWDADLVAELLGERMRGSRMELDILKAISSRDKALERLGEMCRQAAVVTTEEGWNQRWHIGAALIERRDKLGIDILIECLSVKEPWAPKGDTPQALESNLASFRGRLRNTFAFVVRTTDEDFGYPGEGNLAEAIPKMVDWWKANRAKFSFEEALSETVPVIQPDKPLTKRQARVLAAKLATDAFAKQKFKSPNGTPVGKVQFGPESFNDVQQKEGRWILRMVRSAGPEAFVDFKLDGTGEKVVVSYAWD